MSTKCVSRVCRVMESDPKGLKHFEMEMANLHCGIFNFITPCCGINV